MNYFLLLFLPQTIRLDGDYNPRHLSRDDLVALLKARTANAVHSVRTLRLGAHASAVQLIKVHGVLESAQPCLLTTLRDMILFVSFFNCVCLISILAQENGFAFVSCELLLDFIFQADSC